MVEEDANESEEEELDDEPDVGVLWYGTDESVLTTSSWKRRQLNDECPDNCVCLTTTDGAPLYQCTVTYAGIGVYQYNYTGVDEDNFMIQLQLTNETEGLHFAYEYSFVNGTIMDCTATLNGCDCECVYGICPDSEDDPTESPTPELAALKCPGLTEDFGVCEDLTPGQVVELAEYVCPSAAPSRASVAGVLLLAGWSLGQALLGDWW